MNAMVKTSLVLLLLTCFCAESVGQSAAARARKKQRRQNNQQTTQQEPSLKKITKTPEEWKKQLTPMQFYVARQQGTERSFSGKYWDFKKDGIYICVCCQLPLFDSKTKFKSGTGWPSYFRSIDKRYVAEKQDLSHNMVRTEVKCARCDAHLGHVFNDGPRTDRATVLHQFGRTWFHDPRRRCRFVGQSESVQR